MRSKIFKSPRTAQEKRAFYSLADWKSEEEGVDVRIRAKRSARSLPHAWDDVAKNRDKNWKRHRRTKYHSKEGIAA